MSQSTIPNSVYNLNYITPGLTLFKILIGELNTNIDGKFLTFTENTKSCETESVFNDWVMFSKDFKRWYGGKLNN